MKVYNQTLNRLVDSKDQLLTDKIWEAKKNKNPWDVVDMVIKAFKARQPKKYQSYLIRLEALRAAQKKTWVGNKEFRGVVKDKKNDAYLAHTVDFPVWLLMAIRKVYNTKELEMDKKFFREFGKRYPEFRIMEAV